MAAPGRCAGCGRTGTACRIDRHTLECPQFLALRKRSPEAALGAEAEYRRWERDDKPARRLQRRDTALAAARSVRAEQSSRFARLPDILGDE